MCEQNISERDLATFFDRYGPSARTAFKYAASSDEFDDQIQLICTNTSLSKLWKIMHEADTLTLDNELSHQIFVIAPKPDSPCFKHCVQFASPFNANLLYMALHMKSTIEAQEFCGLLISALFSKGSAGNVFEVLAHGAFDQGGYFPIFKMSKSNRIGTANSHWKTPNENPVEHFLYVNSSGFSVQDQQPTSTEKEEPLAYHLFIPSQTTSLETGYYQQVSRTQETLDAFIYECTILV